MKLREHPLLKKHWPPKWRPFFGSTAPVAGEIGVLDEVRPSVLSDRCCFVLMDFRGKKYIARLSFDDDGFCRKFIDFVRRQRGKPIARIAELEISFA
jgi:hypothetical protein